MNRKITLMSEHGLSEFSLREWSALAQSLGGAEPASLAQERLNQFLIGIHSRGEELHAHELKSLLDKSDVHPDVAQELVSFIAPALALLADYDLALAAEEEGEGGEDGEDGDQYLAGDDEFDVEEGVLII